jgi:hypothetical protein
MLRENKKTIRDAVINATNKLNKTGIGTKVARYLKTGEGITLADYNEEPTSQADNSNKKKSKSVKDLIATQTEDHPLQGISDIAKPVDLGPAESTMPSIQDPSNSSELEDSSDEIELGEGFSVTIGG